MRKVLIYRTDVLPRTQTFILAQAKSLTRYAPHFLGLAPAIPSLPLDGLDTCLLTEDVSWRNRLRKAAYRVTGFSPSFHRRVRALGADVLHVHFAEDGPMALPLAVDLKLPMLVTLHGSVEPIDDRKLKRTLGNLLYMMRRKETWKRASLFLCVSQFIYDVAVQTGYPKEKLLVHYTGIDTGKFQYHGSEERDTDLVLFVGRLEEKKGVRYLISSMAEVQRVRPQTKLLIVGDGSQRAALEAQALSLGVRCTFAGVLPPATIAEHLKKARVFCAPSVRAHDGNSEGFGMVFAEAQASGVPVVSFAHGGIPEVVLHGQTGLLAPEGDTGVLAKHLLAVLSESYPWRESSLRGRDWIKSSFDIAQQARKLEEIYDHAVAASN